MTGGFVAIAFGLCASMGLHEGQDVVLMGYQSNGECVVHVALGGSSGPEDTVPIAGHPVAIEMIEGGAVIHIEDQQFVLQKLDAA